MTESEPIRVLIADDNAIFRRGLRIQLDLLPNITVVGEAANGRAAVILGRRLRPQVVLMDLQMPELHGLDATRELAGLESDERVAVVVLTSHADKSFVVRALEAGAVGYLIKTHDVKQMRHAIESAARGEALISSRTTIPLLRELARRRPSEADALALSKLTDAERRVVGMLSSGYTSNEQIALRLHLSVNTVRSQIRTAMKKINVDDRTRLALWGVRNHLDVPPA